MRLYEKNQLVNDLMLIAGTFGQRKCMGYFTGNQYEAGNLKINHIPGSLPIAEYGGVELALDGLHIETIGAHEILKEALRAEELLEGAKTNVLTYRN